MKGDLPVGYVTPCQLAVWRAVALGFMTKEIASGLGVSMKTIGKHRMELCRKIGVRTPADLTRKAIEHAVISVEIKPLQRVSLPDGRVWHVIP